MQIEKHTDGFFEINAKNGFLPKAPPLASLPNRYAALQEIINDLPRVKDDNSPGILSIEGRIETRTQNLPNFKEHVQQENDPFILQALFRSYAFLASAYALAPAHFSFLKNGAYGKAHKSIPPQIAQPFVIVSEKLDVYPWLDYHYAYSLGNYVKIDPNGGFEWENLGMAAKFSGMSDERGFIMLHVDINQHSPKLVQAVLDTQQATSSEALNIALDLAVDSMKKINERRQLMWTASRWKHYNDFRVFIMGIKGNTDIFENGLIYEGVSEEPQQYRGQTGAQDNIIPLMDIFSGIISHYPENELTHYLQDLRSYRPKCVQHFLEDTRLFFKQKENALLERMVVAKNYDGIKKLIELQEEVYYFRNGHWQFVQKYIMQNTVYPKATGGTPIVSWIPNQITAVLNALKSCFEKLPNDYISKHMPEWKEGFDRKQDLLDKQLELLRDKAYDAKKVYSLNKKMKLNDEK